MDRAGGVVRRQPAKRGGGTWGKKVSLIRNKRVEETPTCGQKGWMDEEATGIDDQRRGADGLVHTFRLGPGQKS